MKCINDFNSILTSFKMLSLASVAVLQTLSMASVHTANACSLSVLMDS